MSSFGMSDDFKERVRQATDLVDLASTYLTLRRQGRGYVALCPWHDDTRPSLQISPERQSWKCWVCDIGGDVFSFVEQKEGIGFREALEMLAQRAGLEMPRQHGPATKSGDPNDKPTLYKAAAWAEEQYHRCLLQSPLAEPARQYLADRGIDQQSIERHRIGFAPHEWSWLADQGPAAGHSPLVLEAINLLRRKESGSAYDFFRGRVMFPIRDTQSRTIAFGGRILPQWADDRAPKYLNSSETRLFVKSENLYALDLVRDVQHAAQAPDQRHLVIVEGYTDVVAAWQAGMDNVVAVLGTALGPRHLRVLRRFADRLTLVLDGDEAGQKRSNEVLEMFVAEQIDLRVATLPAGLDPADCIEQRGVDAFRDLIEQAPDALQHKLQTLTAGLDPADLHGAHQVVEEMLRMLAAAPRLSDDVAGGPSRLRQQQVLARLAREFQLPEAEVRQRLQELRSSSNRNRRQQQQATASAEPLRKRLAAADRELLEILILEPQLISAARQEIEVSHVAAGPARIIYQACITLHDRGQEPQFGRLMTALDDPQLKNLLAELGELASDKTEQMPGGAAARLEQLIARVRQRRLHGESQQRLSELQRKANVDPQQEQNALLQLLELQRQRHGISDPTDG